MTTEKLHLPLNTNWSSASVKAWAQSINNADPDSAFQKIDQFAKAVLEQLETLKTNVRALKAPADQEPVTIVQAYDDSALRQSIDLQNTKLEALQNMIDDCKLTDAEKEKIAHAITEIPEVTVESLGLDKVDNTADEDKPLSAAVKEYITSALNGMMTAMNNALAKLSVPPMPELPALYAHNVHLEWKNDYGDKRECWFTVHTTIQDEIARIEEGTYPATGYVEEYSAAGTVIHPIYAFENNKVKYYGGEESCDTARFTDTVEREI